MKRDLPRSTAYEATWKPLTEPGSTQPFRTSRVYAPEIDVHEPTLSGMARLQ